jgi:hypothetical protein
MEVVRGTLEERGPLDRKRHPVDDYTLGCQMTNNNIDFIKSIKDEGAFEELVRQVAKYIYDAEAYLIGGPYDGGRDLIYKRGGREAKEAIQITIQEKNIAAKIVSDANKVRELAAEHGYPQSLTLFWSHPLSGTAQLKLKKEVRDKTGIELEIYDAAQLSQIITEELPESLNYLINEVHNLKPITEPREDPRSRAFYEYLAISKDTTGLKTSIIDAHILSNLYTADCDRSSLVDGLARLNVKSGSVDGRIATLVKAEKIQPKDDTLALSDKERIRLDAILRRDELQREELIQKISAYSISKIGADVSEQAFLIIKSVYAKSAEIQISELSIEPPKLSLVKNLIIELETLISKHTDNNIKGHTKGLIEIASENSYFQNYCSSAICINLLNQRKLQKYVDEKYFFIYMDATVFIQRLCLYGFPNKFIDRERRIVGSLLESIKTLKNSAVRVTRQHLEETIRHLTQAEKISSFANDDLIQRFGDSKNVYFNLYLEAKRQEREDYSFDDFLEKLIGLDKDAQSYAETRFDVFMECVTRFLRIASISVIDHHDSDSLEDDPKARKIVRLYNNRLSRIGKNKKARSILNDLNACYVLAEAKNHLDDKKVGHTPIFVTWDSTQHELRSAFRTEFPHDEWLIYTPQRAMERLSMLQFKMSSEILKDSVMSIIDEDYIKDSSIIDTLAVFLGNDKIESDSVISVLTKLTAKIQNEAVDALDSEGDAKSAISNALVTLQNEYRNRFGELRRLFSDKKSETSLVATLELFTSGKMNDEQLIDEIAKLLANMEGAA